MIEIKRYYLALAAVAGGLCLTACQDETPRASTNLEVADIKGIRFDQPLPEAAATTSPEKNVLASNAAAAPADSGAAPKDLPTAEDVPDNIALIPSATPVPVDPTPAATPAPEAAAPAVASAPADPGSYEEVSFKVLSGFKYVEPMPQEGEKPEDVEKRRNTDQIPPEVKALDGKMAVVQGWMVPMEISEDGAVKSFVLVKTQPECCFGDMQAMNEWVDVIMQPGKSAEFNVDQPVKVYGKLEVGEKTEDGFVLSVYRMQGDRVEI